MWFIYIVDFTVVLSYVQQALKYCVCEGYINIKLFYFCYRVSAGSEDNNINSLESTCSSSFSAPSPCSISSKGHGYEKSLVYRSPDT